MQPKTWRALRRFTAAAAAAVLLFSFLPAARAAASAANITGKCTFTPSSNAASFGNATDGNYATLWASAKTSERYIDFSAASGYTPGGIYFIWSAPPASWTLYAFERSGAMTEALSGGAEGYLTQYVYIPSEYSSYSRFRIAITPASASAAVDLAELQIYGSGSAPYYAPQWEPFSGRADVLTLSAHPDDEDLYLGMPAVTYTGEGKRCATVFMTYGSGSASVRRYEAQESVWALGNRWYPAMGSFQDIKTATKEEQMAYWPLDETVGFIVAQIRRYKPSVVVTHDVRGEYGHGAHMLTEYAATLAFQYAADPAKYPASAEQYGTWQAGKLYVHLYAENALNVMSLTAVPEGFGGRTVLQVVSDAYNRHASQLPGRELPTSGAYDMRKFGLCATSLGPDTAHNTMFENVTEEAMLRLNPWYIFGVVDRSALSAALQEAKKKRQADYTPESWAEAALPEAIAAAQAVMDDAEAMQTAADAQADALRGAMDKLTAYLTGIRVTSPPDRLAYVVGEALDTAGLAVTAEYSDGGEKAVDAAQLTLSGFDSTAPAAAQTVTVSYADARSTRSTAFPVDILPADGERLSSSVYTLDRDGGLLSGVPPGLSAEALFSGFTNHGALSLYAADGSPLSGGAVKGGTVLKLTVGGVVTDALRVSVLGDVSGDGAVDIDDILYIRADIVDTYEFRAWQRAAADLSGDGAVDINDILYIRAHILGTYTIG